MIEAVSFFFLVLGPTDVCIEQLGNSKLLCVMWWPHVHVLSSSDPPFSSLSLFLCLSDFMAAGQDVIC